MSGSSSGLNIPPGYSPPFAVVTDTDHTAWLIIATALGLTCTLLFAAIRLFIRWGVSPGMGIDDACLAAATVVAILQSSIVLGACSDGLGKSIRLVPSALQTKVQQLYFTSNIFFIVAVGLSKLSVVLLLLRLSQADDHKRVFNAAAAFVGAWTVASIFAVALQCDLPQPWVTVGEHCPGTFLRWQVISAFDIVIEMALVGMTVYLVWGLKTSVKKKAVVVGAFAFRLPMIIPIAFRLATFDERGYTTNPTLLEDHFVVWTQTELNYSLISATIPTLRSVMNSLNTHFGGLGQTTSSGSSYGYANPPGEYQMSNLRSVDRSNRGDGYTSQKFAASALDGRVNEYTCHVWAPTTGVDVNNSHADGQRNTAKAGGGDAISVDSNDSRRLIIKRETTFQVAYERD